MGRRSDGKRITPYAGSWAHRLETDRDAAIRDHLKLRLAEVRAARAASQTKETAK